ncbi:MAG: hypothetical protein IH991_06900 [Planctomycetes bacterium]|nr:hypothetical protein [Planctomycetota bacterium]
MPTPVKDCALLSAGSRYDELVRRVKAKHGRITVEDALRLMDRPVAMKSNLHNVLMAPGLGKLWIANAAPDQKPAWTQKYHELDFWKLLEQPLPTAGTEIAAPPRQVSLEQQ